MRSLPLAPLLLGLWVGLTLTGLPAARGADVKDKAGDDKSDKVKFNTVDHVELHGVWYPPTGGGKKTPAVLLLHNVKSDSSKDGWDKLARELQEAGYAVLTFDFRGHGNSTAVDPSFWNDTSSTGLRALTEFNREQCKTGFNPNKPKESISIKDFKTSYYPALVNDIEAARAFLDRKNDGGECNSSNLILIGAEEGASLGALWMASEMSLYRVTSSNPITGLPLRWATTPEGKDVGAAVWLSISPAIGSYNAPVRTWLQMGVKEKKVPMAFLYGDKDTTAANISKSCFAAVKPPREAKTKLTGELPIKDSKLSGNALLGDQLNARKWIIDTYLKAVKEEQVAPAWEEKKDEESAFVWVLQGSNQPIPAKSEKEKVMSPIPWSRFLR
jgi:alpha-beta hydrolase superfamily lysophospholipase